MVNVGERNGALLYALSAIVFPSVRKNQAFGAGVGDGVKRSLLTACYGAVGLYHVAVGYITGCKLVIVYFTVCKPCSLTVVGHVKALLGAVCHVETEEKILAPAGYVFYLKVYRHRTMKKNALQKYNKVFNRSRKVINNYKKIRMDFFYIFIREIIFANTLKQK